MNGREKDVRSSFCRKFCLRIHTNAISLCGFVTFVDRNSDYRHSYPDVQNAKAAASYMHFTRENWEMRDLRNIVARASYVFSAEQRKIMDWHFFGVRRHDAALRFKERGFYGTSALLNDKAASCHRTPKRR